MEKIKHGSVLINTPVEMEIIDNNIIIVVDKKINLKCDTNIISMNDIQKIKNFVEQVYKIGYNTATEFYMNNDVII